MNTRPSPRALRKSAAVSTALIGLLLACPAFAQALYWNTSGTTGTWTAGNWTTDAAGTIASGTSPTSTTDAVFVASAIAGNTVTVTLSGTNDVNSLTFLANETTTLSGGTIDLYGATDGFNTSGYGINAANTANISSAIALQDSQIWNISADNTTVSGVISGSTFGITKTGAGSLILSGANTFSGGITLDAGTLVLNSVTGAGTGTITINGGTLYGQTGGGWIGAIANSMVWNSSFTITQAGKPFVFSGSTLLGSNNITVTANGNNPSKDVVVSGAISDGGNNYGLAISGLIVFSGANTYTGATTINSGSTLIIGGTTAGGNLAAGTTGSLAASGTIVDNGTLTFNRTNTVTQGTDFSAAAITGTGNITQQGGGTVALNAANTYSGTTTISSGTISTSNISALGTSAVTISGGTLAVTSAGLTGLGTFTFSSGSLSLNATTAALAANKNFSMSGGTWTANIESTSAYDQITGSGTGKFTITGGTLDLTGSIDYSATYTILSGFSSGSVAGLSITGYDTTDYTASLSDTGVLSFTSAIPEPAAYGFLGGLAALVTVIARRRRKARAA